ncbi:MAG TPA: isoleucine--tRNA ligase [Planctomycetota bacterium]|jgi:isoleucyl-tRNA synthetase|nr:isoleucine--tRNA ligase [Planctomycetota bacterium]
MGRTDLFQPLPGEVESRPSGAETEVLRAWREQKTFETVQRARSGAPPFVFWEGPPTANGRPGIHHVLARTIKDSVCRYQTMRGKRVERKAGWDTHGLPVELEVEKKLGISGKPQIEALDGGVARFNRECRESVWTYKKEWEELSERTGYWLDYASPYVTYEPEYIESVWYLLALFHGKGLVYRGKRVLPYCGRCGTGLSSHELAQPGVYREISDPSVVLRFRLPDGDSLLAWTTTPWTLPSNFALAVHPKRDYVRARVLKKKGSGSEPGEIVWVVRERLPAVLGAAGVDFEELGHRPGMELVGLEYAPLFDARLPEIDGGWQKAGPAHRVQSGEFVTVEDGTGIVHQAPYGADDWDLARRNKLPVSLAVGDDGRFSRDVGPVKSGTWFKDADDALIADLKARHLLFDKVHAPHSYPHCWRCSTPLYYFPAPAWYIRTTAYRDRMVASNRAIRWVPPELEKRFGEWLENNIDWNISRDRYWGTPLPFWVCSNAACGHEVAIGSRKELEERTHSALPADLDLHKPGIDRIEFACPRCSGVMRRTPAVLDCWFDSGAMPYAQHGWPHKAGSDARLRAQFPADFIAEGLDQTRGWFYTLHAIGSFVTSIPELGLPDGPAYKSCVVNGLLLDKDGVKMSKRLGNVVDPWKTVDEHGADAVRWYLLSSGNPWLPKRFDPAGILEVRRKFLGTLVNSYKFFAEYARLDGFDPRNPAIPAPSARPEIDRWLLSRTQSLVAEVTADLDAYDIAGACRAIETFVVDDLSNWYIRRNRRRFWKSEQGADKLAAFATLHAGLAAATLLAAPVAPFLTELLWRRLSGSDASVHAELFPAPDAARVDRTLEASMRIVTRVVELGRALRDRSGLKIRQPLRAIHVRTSDPEGLLLLAEPFAKELLLGELNIKTLGSLAADDGALCVLKAKANFRALGKRLGGAMKAAAAVIEKLPAESIARLRAGNPVGVEVDGRAVELSPEDVQVSVETRADFDVETDGQYVVFLDTTLDDDLVVEGLAREVINRVNGLRKDSGLAVEDRIRLRATAVRGDQVLKALSAQRQLIQTETLAVELTVEDGEADGPGGSASASSREFDLGDGRALRIGLAKV